MWERKSKGQKTKRRSKNLAANQRRTTTANGSGTSTQPFDVIVMAYSSVERTLPFLLPV
jgi:hypothetical protein